VKELFVLKKEDIKKCFARSMKVSREMLTAEKRRLEEE